MVAVRSIPFLTIGKDLCVTGSALLFQGCDLLSRAIECFSEFSHCAPIIRLEDFGVQEGLVLFEALKHGITPNCLIERCTAYEGYIYLFVPEGLTFDAKQGFYRYLLRKHMDGTPFDFPALLENAIVHVKEDDTALFCSEAYDAALQAGGLSRSAYSDVSLAPRPGDIPKWWRGTVFRLLPPFSHIEPIKAQAI